MLSTQNLHNLLHLAIKGGRRVYVELPVTGREWGLTLIPYSKNLIKQSLGRLLKADRGKLPAEISDLQLDTILKAYRQGICVLISITLPWYYWCAMIYGLFRLTTL